MHTTTTTVSPPERAETFRSRRFCAGPSFAPRTKHADTSEGAGEHGKQVSQRARLIPTQKWGSQYFCCVVGGSAGVLLPTQTFVMFVEGQPLSSFDWEYVFGGSTGILTRQLVFVMFLAGRSGVFA